MKVEALVDDVKPKYKINDGEKEKSLRVVLIIGEYCGDDLCKFDALLGERVVLNVDEKQIKLAMGK